MVGPRRGRSLIGRGDRLPRVFLRCPSVVELECAGEMRGPLEAQLERDALDRALVGQHLTRHNQSPLIQPTLGSKAEGSMGIALQLPSGDFELLAQAIGAIAAFVRPFLPPSTIVDVGAIHVIQARMNTPDARSNENLVRDPDSTPADVPPALGREWRAASLMIVFEFISVGNGTSEACPPVTYLTPSHPLFFQRKTHWLTLFLQPVGALIPSARPEGREKVWSPDDSHGKGRRISISIRVSAVAASCAIGAMADSKTARAVSHEH
jgi:hypothetical protein